MMHIVLLILKIVGIILLSLLGIVLLFALSVLFIPLRYKVTGDWHGQAKGVARVHWFFHILYFRADYDQKKGLLMKLRIFGIPIWRTRKEEPAEAAVKETKQLGEDEMAALNRELELDEQQYRDSVEKNRERGKAPAARGGADEGSADEGSADEGSPDGGKESGSESGPMAAWLLNIISRIRNTLEKLWFSFQKFYGKLKGAEEFIRAKREWLENEKNQASLRLLWRQLRRLIAHLWPVKGRGTVTFGFDDPYTTGQALQVASLIYPFYHRQLSIYPVFDRQILEGEGSFQGRIRLGFLLWLVIQVYCDKHTWKLVRSFI